MASYRKRDGSWEYRISYKAPDGSYRQKSKRGYRTKADAQRAAAQAEIELSGRLEIDDTITLAAYYDQWADVHKKPHISMGSWKGYQTTSKVIHKYFQHTKLRAISSTDYQRFINDLGQQYAHGTLKGIHHKIKRAIMQAVADGYIQRNFTELAKISSAKASTPLEDKFLQLDKYKELLDTLKAQVPDKNSVHLYLLAVTGMRLGESLGLTWADIDFQGQLINIDKTWDIYNNEGFRTTKNQQSVRKIPLDPTTALILKKYKLASWQPNKHDRIFSRCNHTWLNILVKRLTGTNIHVHSLRHTYASYLIAQDIDLMTVSSLLGHKNLTVTLNTYVHQLEAKKEQDFEDVKKLFG